MLTPHNILGGRCVVVVIDEVSIDVKALVTVDFLSDEYVLIVVWLFEENGAVLMGRGWQCYVVVPAFTSGM